MTRMTHFSTLHFQKETNPVIPLQIHWLPISYIYLYKTYNILSTAHLFAYLFMGLT